MTFLGNSWFIILKNTGDLMPDQGNDKKGEDFFAWLRAAVNLIHFWAQMHVVLIDLYRIKLGTAGSRRWTTVPVIAAFFYVPAFASQFPRGHEAQLLMIAWSFMLPMLVLHHVAHAIRVRRGSVIHSQYIGDSYSYRLVPWGKREATLGRDILLTLLIACFTAPYAIALSFYLAVGAAALGFRNAMILQRDAYVLRSMTDSELEVQYYSEMHRGIR